MALSNQALALISISALLLSTFTVEAHLAPSPTPTPTPTPGSLKFSPSPSPSPSPSSSPAESAELESADLISFNVEAQVVTDIVIPLDVKLQMTKYVEGNMQVTMQKIEEFSESLKKRLDDPETTSATKECIKQCNEVYDSAKDDIKISLKDIKAGDLYKANFDISSISTNVDTCEQCFEEMVGEDPELKKFDDWVRGITDDCLGALGKAAS